MTEEFLPDTLRKLLHALLTNESGKDGGRQKEMPIAFDKTC